MINPSGGGPVAFFELAATLIPILIFGGVVVERNRPRSDHRSLLAFIYANVIPLFGSLAALAEMTSIAAVIRGGASAVFVGFVAAVIALGMVGVVVAVWAPWLRIFRSRPSARSDRLLVSSGGVLLLAVGIGTVLTIVLAVDGAHSLDRKLSEESLCSHRYERVERAARRNIHEKAEVNLREREDYRNGGDANVALVKAELAEAPRRLLRLLKGRVENEMEAFNQDLDSQIRLNRQGRVLSRKLGPGLCT